MKKGLYRVIIAAVLVAAVLAGWFYWRRSAETPVLFRTENVHVGDLRRTIDATGTVEPEDLINVGAQVAGRIVRFGTDLDGGRVDYGSRVAEGGLLAQIDDALYVAVLKEAEGALIQAEARIRQAEAQLEQQCTATALAESNYSRAARLRESGAIAENLYESTLSERDVSLALLKTCEAALAEAEGIRIQREAAVERARHDLEYCTIASPVDGVIIDRRVNVGQTVVSSMNAPSLFLLARDLSRVQVWVAVNEADIGRVIRGQPVEFTVDAYPGERFTGAVAKIRLNAALAQNVVTYTVEITTANPDLKLLPYMTAGVRFLLDERNGVPSISNAALRWQPPVELVEPGDRHILDSPPPSAGETGFIWTLGETGLRPHRLTLGISDGSRTEILDGVPADDCEIVSGILTAEAARHSRVSPFLPQAKRRL